MNGVVEEGGEKFLLFLVSTPVDEAVPEGAVSLEGIRFYDAQGRDRTEELDRSSGRIAGRE